MASDLRFLFSILTVRIATHTWCRAACWRFAGEPAPNGDLHRKLSEPHAAGEPPVRKRGTCRRTVPVVTTSGLRRGAA
jgi:hypothetical protein